MSIERGGVASREPGGEGDEKRKKELLALVDRVTEAILEKNFGTFLNKEDKQDARQEVQAFFLELLNKERDRALNLEEGNRGYMRGMIMHVVIDFLRKNQRGSKVRVEARRLIEYAENIVTREGGEPREKLGMGIEKWHALIEAAERGTMVDVSDEYFEGIVDDKEPTEDQMIDRDRLQKMLSFLEENKRISERNKNIFKAYYIDERLYKDIGKEHGVTESRASQIVNKVREILEEEMKKSRY